MSFKLRLGIIYAVLLASIASAFVPLVVGLIYCACAITQRNKVFAIAALAWLAYAYYEHLIQTGVLCNRERNIRADFLIIEPLLAYCSRKPT